MYNGGNGYTELPSLPEELPGSPIQQLLLETILLVERPLLKDGVDHLTDQATINVAAFFVHLGLLDQFIQSLLTPLYPCTCVASTHMCDQ